MPTLYDSRPHAVPTTARQSADLAADTCRAFPGLSVHDLGGSVTLHGVAAVARTFRGGLRVFCFDRDAAHWLAGKALAKGWGASDVERLRGPLNTWAFTALPL